ncbi:MAG: formylglycine-generating enzyme family protein [Thermoguttaceae bacterium]
MTKQLERLKMGVNQQLPGNRRFFVPSLILWTLFLFGIGFYLYNRESDDPRLESSELTAESIPIVISGDSAQKTEQQRGATTISSSSSSSSSSTSSAATSAPLSATATSQRLLSQIAPMKRLEGGLFKRGNQLGGNPDQRPAHDVRLSPFEMDIYAVTNRQFRLFVDATGHQTSAERRGWSYIFDYPQKSWVRMPDISWKTPTNDPLLKQPLDIWLELPVVHVSYHDAVAFSNWAGKRLPTEAEWEYAARSGRLDSPFPWGEQREPKGQFCANYWQGIFPEQNTGADGFLGLSPVGSFPPNDYGLYDIVGNAAQWCSDRFDSRYYEHSPSDNPKGPDESEGELATVQTLLDRPDHLERVPFRVIRGGSFLSAENTDVGYNVANRSKQPENLSYEDLGFRCVK